VQCMPSPLQEMPIFLEDLLEGDLSQQLHFMRWPGICRPEPPYDTYVSVSDSNDGFDDFPDVDGWGFGFGT
jgi:hypothetical protein